RAAVDPRGPRALRGEPDPGRPAAGHAATNILQAVERVQRRAPAPPPRLNRPGGHRGLRLGPCSLELLADCSTPRPLGRMESAPGDGLLLADCRSREGERS